MAKSDHFALLVTINRYPGLQDLQGPENDGEAFKQWLLDPQGGDLDAGHVVHIRSSDYGVVNNADDARPTEREMVRVLNGWMRTADDWKDKVGERLYMFMAGHGFTAGSSISDPALFTAVAQSGDPNHIAGYQFASKIANAGFFDEIVLVMDCCQDVLKATRVIEPSWSPPDRGRSSRVKLMQAYGAPRGRKAFERELVPGGGPHGLFSSVLVEALRSALPDSEGWVTGQAVKSQILQIWSQRFKAEVDYDPPVRLPDAEDIKLYRRAQPAPAVSVDLSAMIGQAASTMVATRGMLPRGRRVRRGDPGDAVAAVALPQRIDVSAAVGGARPVGMPPGLYALETPQGLPDLAFEVLPSMGLEAPVVGHPVSGLALPASLPVDELLGDLLGGVPRPAVVVTINSPDPGLEIVLTDANFNKVATGPAPLSLKLSPGLYKAQARLAGAVCEALFRVDAQACSVDLPQLAFPSAAPVKDTASSHEYQTYPAQQATLHRPAVPWGGAHEGDLYVLARDGQHDWRSPPLAAPYPWQGLSLTSLRQPDLGPRPLLDEAHQAEVVPAAGYAHDKLALPAGWYVLSQAAQAGQPAGETAMLVPVIKGWRTEVYLACMDDPRTGARVLDGSAASVLLLEMGQPGALTDPAGRATEIMRLRLSQGGHQAAVTDEVLGMAARSPMLALYAAYAALQSDPQDVEAVQRCLAAMPPAVRQALPDAILLDRWCASAGADVVAVPAQADQDQPEARWIMPMMAAGWSLPPPPRPDRTGRPAPRLHELAVEAVGQWRLSGSLWTLWRHPPTKAAALLRRLSEGALPARSSPALEPPWSVAHWRVAEQGLRAINPDFSPFQQALRRSVLNGLEDGELPPGEVERIARAFGLSPALAARAYREVFLAARDRGH